MISKLKEGKIVILQQVYTLYFDKVYRFCYSYTKNRDLAMDISQEVFLKIWRNRQNIAEDIPLEQQLFVISKNLIFDYFRRKVKEQEVLLSYKQALTIESTDDSEVKEIRLKKIYSCIDQLPKKQQKVIKMHRFQGLTYEEISEILNISVNTVSAHISSGMRFIKKNVI